MINEVNEDYCSFEVSKLLEEKGFHVICRRWWELFGDNDLFEPISPADYNDRKTFVKVVSAPTHAIAKEWLRVNFGVWIEIYQAPKKQVNYVGYYTVLDGEEYEFDTPQEIMEYALKFILSKMPKE